MNNKSFLEQEEEFFIEQMRKDQFKINNILFGIENKINKQGMNITQEQPEENKELNKFINNYKVKEVLEQMFKDQLFYGISGCKLENNKFTILTIEEIAKLKND
jgi:hypothetical protein